MTKTEVIIKLINENKRRLEDFKNRDLIDIVINKYDLVMEYHIQLEQYESLLEQIKIKGEDLAIENRIKGLTNNILQSHHVKNSTCIMANRYHYTTMCMNTKILEELKNL